VLLLLRLPLDGVSVDEPLRLLLRVLRLLLVVRLLLSLVV
jgi:hypothetical protein